MALVQCNECGEKVSTKAKTCPSCGAKPPKEKSSLGKLVLWTILLTFPVMIFLGESAPPEQRAETAASRALSQQAKQEKAAAQRCSDDVMAFTLANDYVKKTLKSPRSAKFASIVNPAVSRTYLGDCTHRIQGYVDADNAFGANIRQRYEVVVQNVKGTETWRLIDLVM